MKPEICKRSVFLLLLCFLGCFVVLVLTKVMAIPGQRRSSENKSRPAVIAELRQLVTRLEDDPENDMVAAKLAEYFATQDGWERTQVLAQMKTLGPTYTTDR